MTRLYFGDNLKKLRKERNLSQEQLAEMLNISRQAVSKWEAGKTYPDIDNLLLLRNLFNVTLDDLVVNEYIDKCKDVSGIDKLSEEINNKSKDEEYDNEEDDDLSTKLMIGGMIIGMAIGFITDNFMWGTVGCFIGMGLGYVVEDIISAITKIKR